ncbi:hypothetical protein GE061_016879 [Apolygus lucorum]|uniref:Pericentrin/AKAP-450 centrosomal targeting domain-containing protein n=1 Tax=Apolygus lucorum TaxID=248454 RepID=A0A6A4JMY3_APOLU|nr:hypothetical protein GE061_016879 [Apolygus lucorum]
MAGASNRSPETIQFGRVFERGRDVSDFSKDELLAHIDALEMEISGKDGIIQSLQGDLSVSSDQIMNIPSGYRLRLENTVTEQNLTIEALKEELERKQKEFKKLTSELFSLKAEASHEISALQEETERNKKMWEQEKTDLENILKDKLEAFARKTAELDCSLHSEVDKNHLLEKQVELLSRRIEELYQRGVDHDEEFEVILKHWEEEMNELRRSCQPLDPSQGGQKISPELVDSLRRQLADCLSKNAELSALVKSSEKVRQGVREELQRSLQSALGQIEVVTSNLKETEQKKAELEELCRTHESELISLKNDLTKTFNTDLSTLNKAFNHVHKLIGCFSLSSSETDGEMFPDLDSSNEGDAECVSGNMMDCLIDKIDKCSMAIEKHYDSFTELVVENEELRNQNELLRKNAEEVDRYKEAIVHLKAELDKIKQHYELLGKNNENVIMTLKKDLEASNNSLTLQAEKIGLINKLTEDFTASKKKCSVLEKKYRKLKDLLASRGIGTEDECDKSIEHKDTMIEHKETQCELMQYLCLKCSEAGLESGNLSPISKFKVSSDVTPPKSNSLQQFTTSTPFPSHLKGGGESAVPPVALDSSQYQIALIRWMENCRDLSSENGDLKNKISELQMRNKDLELSARGIHEEMQVFDLKRKDLEIKLSDYANLKNKSCQLAERLKLNELKISAMEKDLDLLQRQNRTLSEENMKFEGKFKELLAASDRRDGGTLNISESLFNDLSNKVNEIILLKGQCGALGHAKRALEERNSNLEEVKNLYVLKLEETTRELTNCRNDLEMMIQNNIKLTTANRSFEKEVRMLTIRVEHLNGLKELSWGRTEQNLLAEQMQKDILAICKENLDKKFEYEKMMTGGKKADLRVDEFDARHRLELLMKENGQLSHEKETLLMTIAEQQKLIQEFQKGSGCDEGWLRHLEETERNLLQEMKDHKEQHARIEEALRSTGSLHNELQKEKDEIKIKIIEFAKLEKKYQTEKLKGQQLEMELRLLKQEIIDKRELMKILENEKRQLNDNLSTVQSALEVTQEKLEFEIQCNRVRLKHVELQNANNEMLENFLTSTQEEKPFFDVDVEYHQKIRQEVEAQYNQALQKMRHYMTTEFSMKAQEEQSDHVKQINHFKTIIIQQSEALEKLSSIQILKELTGEDHDYGTQLENMGKCKAEMEAAISAVGNQELSGKIRKSFQDYFNHQLYLAQKLLQDEHRAQYALSVSTWEHLRESELKLVKLQLQGAQLKGCNFAEVPPKEDSITAQEEFPNESRGLTTSQYIFHVLLKSYFSHVQKYTGSWCSTLQKEIKNIDAEMRKEMMNFGNQIEKNLKDRDFAKEQLLIAKGDGLVKAAKGFVESIQGFKNELLSGLTQALDSVFDATKNTLQDFKRENCQLDKLVSLEEELVKLKREKDEADSQYKSALQLLKSDHASEVRKLDSILLELKHLSEIGCRADALLKLKDELEEKHKKEAEEMRMWFERKVADLEKNFSEEVFSQHSRKMSSSSSCPDDDLDRDKYASASEFQCETEAQNDTLPEMVDLNELFPSSESKGVGGKGSRKVHRSNRCSDCVSCAAKILSRLILDESHQEVEHELMRAVNKQEIEGLRSLSSRESRLFTQGIADWEIEERGATIITKTIDKIGVECFKSLKEHLESNIKEQLRTFDTTMTDKMSSIQRKLDTEGNKLSKLDTKISAFSEMQSEKLAEEKKPEVIGKSDDFIEYDRLLKDSDDLDKIKKTLKILVSQMSQYLRDSENELVKRIKSEILKLCPEAVEVEETTNVDAPKPGKHVHFGANLSNIIEELDSTINSESVLDWTHDSSTRFRSDIHSCIRKLKLEAAALYKLSHQANMVGGDSNKVESQIEALRKENMSLLQEMNELKMASQSRLDVSAQSHVSFCSELEAVYGDVGDPPNSSLPDARYLLNKARKHLLNIKEHSTSKALEDILNEGDGVIDDLQIRCDDLEQQVDAADKQLRSTRQFLEEQAVEREGERDEYNQKVSNLQALLKEKDKESSLRERFNSEVLASEAKKAPPSSRKMEELNKELKETVDRLNESIEKEGSLQGELKAAVDQIWVLRDIIRNLESQISAKTDKETEFENKIDQLERELDEKNGTQSVMAHEIETLRNQSLEESRGFEQLQELEENIKLRFNSSVIRQFQAQIREMGKMLDSQTKELEGNNVGVSSNSLSSPSEEISIREHLEFFNRSKTPEHCPSPVSLPVDEVNKLNEKIVRHARADEVILKKLRDQEIRIVKVTNFAEEMQAERDILHEHVEKLKTQIVDANNKIDFLRHKADESNAAATRDIINENQNLKDSLSEAERTLNKLNHTLLEKESQLENAEEVISVQQDKLRSLVQCDENALDSLRLELAAVIAEKNKLEGLVEKYKSDLEKYGTRPSELKALLSDKNEDIKLLQETIARFQNDTDKSSKSSSKGLRVSFAADPESPDVSHESRLRDCPQNESFHFDDPSHIMPLKSSTHRDIEVSLLQHPTVEPVLDGSLGKNIADKVDDGEMDKLRLQLLEKDQHVSKLEDQLSVFKKIEKDLLKTKTQLEATVAAITEDKKYYEEQLTSLFDEIKSKDEKCCSLEKLLSQKGTEIIKLSSDFQTVQNLVKITQEKLNEAQILAKQENIGCETYQAKVASIEKENARLASENCSLLDNLNRLKLDNENLGSQIENLISENETIQGKLTEVIVLKESLADECRELCAMKTDLENRVKEVDAENRKLKSQLAKFESERKHFEKTQEHLTSVLSEYESLQTTLNNMRVAYEKQSFETEQLRTAASKAAGLQNEVALLQREGERLGDALKTERNTKIGLQKRLDELSKGFESFKNEKVALLEEKSGLVASNKEMSKELENFRVSVKNLREDLSSLKKKEGPYISLLSSIDCDDVKKLYLEVTKLISEVGQLEFERNCLQQELAKMKSSAAEIVLKESELNKLGEQISRLENLNAELKANNYQHSEQLRAEIVKLSQDIQFLQSIEQQASEKLTASLTDNKKLGSKLSKMEKEFNRFVSSRKATSEKGFQITISPNLSRTATELFEHVPETNERREPVDSRRFESSFQHPTVARDVGCQCGRKSQNSAFEVALYEKMKMIEGLKDKLHSEESYSRSLRAEKLDIELNLKTLEKINRLQEKKLEIISSEMRQMSNDRLQLELDVHNEKTSRLHAENELNTERMKTQSIQMENINMMENMRARLKLAMENEAKLKTMVIEKHEECERAVAKLNSVMKRLAESQETCRTLRFELEKQTRVNADLNGVLARERRSLASVQDQLKSLEGENVKLRTDLNNEVIKREILQDKLNEYMSANERSASADSDRVQCLLREIDRLKEKVGILQELNDQWRANAFSPAIGQLNELNSNVDSLAKEKRELLSCINDLERERNFLSGQIFKMREERANMRLSSEKMDFTPSVSAKLDIYLGRYFRAESYRKSLVMQKRYLMALLSGFDRSHQKTLSVLAPNFKKTRRRPSFKGVVQTVVAINRMKFFVRMRKTACEAAYMGVLRSLGFTSEDALNKANQHEGRPPAHMVLSNSPPTKEYPLSEGSRRLKVQTASHSDYLAALQEVQKLTRKT